MSARSLANSDLVLRNLTVTGTLLVDNQTVDNTYDDEDLTFKGTGDLVVTGSVTSGSTSGSATAPYWETIPYQITGNNTDNSFDITLAYPNGTTNCMYNLAYVNFYEGSNGTYDEQPSSQACGQLILSIYTATGFTCTFDSNSGNNKNLIINNL